MNTDDVPPSDSPNPLDSTTTQTPSVPPPPAPIDWGYWIRRLLVCNPFFLCSAALLLFAINRLYNDPNFLSNETQNLLFNFSALQVYELLLIGTAVILARRRIWYDSALLVVLENGLLLLPFMLISQAALIDDRLAWALILGGGLAAFARFAALKRWYPQFNLPPRAIALGAVLLAVNVALPRIFRRLIAEDFDDWQTPNLIAWYAALPLLAAGANLLSRPARYGGLNPERHWLPIFLYALWLAGTGVHIWSVGHIAERPFEFPLLAPVVWVSAWTLWNRLRDFVAEPSVRLQKSVLALAFVAPFIAAKDPTVLTVLAALNIVAFLVFVSRPSLAFASLLIAFAGMPLPIHLNRIEHVGLALLIYCFVHALRSRDPAGAVLGALAVGIGIGWLTPLSAQAGLQAAFAFFLAHSLRWPADPKRPYSIVRNLAGVCWIIHALIWTREGWSESAYVAAASIFALSIWGLHLWRHKRRGPLTIPISAAATLLAGPANWFMANGSAGLIALAASLLLFGLGTALALTRQRWEQLLKSETVR